MQALLRQMGMGMGGGEEAAADVPVPDTAETIYISSLALLKMLKHGAYAAAGLPGCAELARCTPRNGSRVGSPRLAQYLRPAAPARRRRLGSRRLRRKEAVLPLPLL